MCLEAQYRTALDKEKMTVVTYGSASKPVAHLRRRAATAALLPEASAPTCSAASRKTWWSYKWEFLDGGRLKVLALFDKPDPLEGSFFEETIYVTPSRLSEYWQSRVMDATAQAVVALGLKDGPIHAELRLNDQGPWVIEVGAPSAGCAPGNSGSELGSASRS